LEPKRRGFRVQLMLAIGIPCLLAVAIAAISGAGPMGDQPDTQRVASAVAIWAPGARPPAPRLEGEALTGEEISLGGLRGSVVVVNIWGSWCAPCGQEAPDLRAVAEESRGTAVRFLGINTRDTRGASQAFTRRFGLPYPSLLDPDGALVRRFSGTIPAQAVQHDRHRPGRLHRRAGDRQGDRADAAGSDPRSRSRPGRALVKVGPRGRRLLSDYYLG
jgi:peroxiredoxin